MVAYHHLCVVRWCTRVVDRVPLDADGSIGALVVVTKGLGLRGRGQWFDAVDCRIRKTECGIVVSDLTSLHNITRPTQG